MLHPLAECLCCFHSCYDTQSPAYLSSKVNGLTPLPFPLLVLHQDLCSLARYLVALLIGVAGQLSSLRWSITTRAAEIVVSDSRGSRCTPMAQMVYSRMTAFPLIVLVWYRCGGHNGVALRQPDRQEDAP